MNPKTKAILNQWLTEHKHKHNHVGLNSGPEITLNGVFNLESLVKAIYNEAINLKESDESIRARCEVVLDKFFLSI